MDPRPIAVFDSGVGGLTVAAALRRALPDEPLVYLGDTARLPYGSKSPAVVERYALACAQFLQAQDVKLLVVACNTASAHALPRLEATLPFAVLGVVEPGAAAAAAASCHGRIGVLATEGTVRSGCYQAALARLAPRATVLAVPAPLLVPLAEEGLTDHPATRLLAAEYLQPLLGADIDTLVLGCTHYPLLQPLLQRLCGPEVAVVSSAGAVAAAAATLLAERRLRAPTRSAAAADRFFATDVGERLQRVGSAFLGTPMPPVRWVDLPAPPAGARI